jgi:hypothetical protein
MDHSRDMKKLLIDGIRFYPKPEVNEWVLVLPEKERPYCEILVDAMTEGDADVLADDYAKRVFVWRGGNQDSEG